MATFQRKATTNPHDGLVNTMLVLEEGTTSSIARPSSAGNKIKAMKKASSGELIVLSTDNESSVGQTTDGSSKDNGRTGSAAGRIEKRLELTRVKDNENDNERSNSAGTKDKPQSILPLNRHQNQQLVTWNSSTRIVNEPIKDVARAPQDDKKVVLNTVCGESGQSSEITQETESSDEDSSDDDDDDDDDDDGDEEPPRAPSSGTLTQSDSPKAPIELMGQFLNLVMSEDYEQAQELCHQILLLEPENSTCQEFLAVIAEKIKQDEENEDESDDDDDSSDDDDDDDDDDDVSDDDDDDGNDSGRESDEDEDDESSDSDVELPPGPVNLLMGGLPVILQSPNKPE